jgi:hypothetical protein
MLLRRRTGLHHAVPYIFPVVDMPCNAIKKILVPPKNIRDGQSVSNAAAAPMLLHRRSGLHHAVLQFFFAGPGNA